jgi:hypothetical protein
MLGHKKSDTVLWGWFLAYLNLSPWRFFDDFSWKTTSDHAFSQRNPFWHFSCGFYWQFTPPKKTFFLLKFRSLLRGLWALVAFLKPFPSWIGLLWSWFNSSNNKGNILNHHEKLLKNQTFFCGVAFFMANTVYVGAESQQRGEVIVIVAKMDLMLLKHHHWWQQWVFSPDEIDAPSSESTYLAGATSAVDGVERGQKNCNGVSCCVEVQYFSIPSLKC